MHSLRNKNLTGKPDLDNNKNTKKGGEVGTKKKGSEIKTQNSLVDNEEKKSRRPGFGTE